MRASLNVNRPATEACLGRRPVHFRFVFHRKFDGGSSTAREQWRTVDLASTDVHLQAGQLIHLHAATKTLTDKLDEVIRRLK